MGVKSKSQIKKAQLRGRDETKKIRKKLWQEVAELEGVDKLKYELTNINSNIKNCEFDLENQFKGHAGIINKLNQLKIRKQEIDEKIKNETESVNTKTQ